MIKHKEVLQAILDGKTVQYKPPLNVAWLDYAPVVETVVEVAETTQGQWRIKPEPEVMWAPVVWNGVAGTLPERQSCIDHWSAKQLLRLEFIDGKCVSVTLEDA